MGLENQNQNQKRDFDDLEKCFTRLSAQVIFPYNVKPSSM